MIGRSIMAALLAATALASGNEAWAASASVFPKPPEDPSAVTVAGRGAGRADDSDGRVLAVQIGTRALLNGLRDFLHSLRAGGRSQYKSDCIDAIKQRDHAAGDDKNIESHPLIPLFFW